MILLAAHAISPYPAQDRMRFGGDSLREACNRMGAILLKGIFELFWSLANFLKRIHEGKSLKRLFGAGFLKRIGILLREILLKGSCMNPVKPLKALFVATGPYARVRKVLQLAPADRLRGKTGLIVSIVMLMAIERRLRDGSGRVGGRPTLREGAKLAHGAYTRPQTGNLRGNPLASLLAKLSISLASDLKTASVLHSAGRETLAS